MGGHPRARFSFAISYQAMHLQMKPLAHHFVHYPMCDFF
jgi:hypothetical protein